MLGRWKPISRGGRILTDVNHSKLHTRRTGLPFGYRLPAPPTAALPSDTSHGTAYALVNHAPPPVHSAEGEWAGLPVRACHPINAFLGKVGELSQARLPGVLLRKSLPGTVTPPSGLCRASDCEAKTVWSGLPRVTPADPPKANGDRGQEGDKTQRALITQSPPQSPL